MLRLQRRPLLAELKTNLKLPWPRSKNRQRVETDSIRQRKYTSTKISNVSQQQEKTALQRVCELNRGLTIKDEDIFKRELWRSSKREASSCFKILAVKASRK